MNTQQDPSFDGNNTFNSKDDPFSRQDKESDGLFVVEHTDNPNETDDLSLESSSDTSMRPREWHGLFYFFSQDYLRDRAQDFLDQNPNLTPEELNIKISIIRFGRIFLGANLLIMAIGLFFIFLVFLFF